jgi:hypothetical protein
MAWEQVGRRRYYYRSQWVKGRSVRRYVGTGPVAELAAAADELRRLERAVAARQRQAERARVREVDRAVLRLFTLAGLVASAALVARGLYKHGGEWRCGHGGDHATVAG